MSVITIVSGLPRSGTSMMMQMLEGGGLVVLSDGERESDVSNPNGYYEYQKVKTLIRSKDWVHEAEGKVLKVIAQLLLHLPSNYKYKVIYMERDVEEVLASQEKMLGRKNPENLGVMFSKQMTRVDQWAENQQDVEVLKVNYKEAIQSPAKIAKEVQSFLDLNMDLEAMVERVDSTLYRNKC